LSACNDVPATDLNSEEYTAMLETMDEDEDLKNNEYGLAI